MDNEATIKKLKFIANQAEIVMIDAQGLKEEATVLIRELEGVSTPSLHQGLNDAERNKVLLKRRRRMIK